MSFIIILIIILGSAIGIITFFLIKSIIAPKKVTTVANMIKQGKASSAIRIGKQIIAKDNRNPEAHYLLGNAYLAENKHELALMEFRTVNQIGHFGGYCPEVQFRKKIADLYIRFNQPEEALKEYLLLVKHEPNVADHYYKIGELFEERNKSAKAVNFYRKAIELNQRHALAHYHLGYLLYRGKRPVEAKNELELTIKFRPDLYKAYFYLGRLLKENHDYVGALLAFEKAQRDNDFKIKALVERGSAYMNMNNFDKAITELERAVKLVEGDYSNEALFARYFLSLSYEKTRKLERAVELWELIYSKKPGFRDVAEKLSQYQELRTDDHMKDYLTVNMDKFYDMCKSIAFALDLTVRDVQDIPNGCQLIAIESETKWRNARKLPRLMRFYRVPDMITESTVRSFHEEMKKLSVARGVIFSSSHFSRKALEYAETRPIDLFNKEDLQEQLKKIYQQQAAAR